MHSASDAKSSHEKTCDQLQKKKQCLTLRTATSLEPVENRSHSEAYVMKR